MKSCSLSLACSIHELNRPLFAVVECLDTSRCNSTVIDSSHQFSLSPPPFLHSQGSNATGDCCSKCFNALQKSSPPAPVAQPITTSPEPSPAVEEPVTAVQSTPVLAAEPTKKKKKKASYKNMLAGMMEGTGQRDAEKEKEGIKRVTGGGQFSKIDKI